MFFGDDSIAIPVGFDNWIANALCVILIAVLVIHAVKLLLPKPAMERQLALLEERLMVRLGKQDEDEEARISGLRADINTEVFRIHQRIDTHGRELYQLKGYVDGRMRS